MERVLEILKSVRDDIDYENEKSLVDDGILDSFDIVGIVSELIEEYEIEITINDMTSDNFNNVEAIYAMVNRLLEEI
ncbi:MAG: acyl carrier protein [Lachnospiraceae bacterium]|nr:acyl carrier protein [Lachnospiraceae bacterium]